MMFVPMKLIAVICEKVKAVKNSPLVGPFDKLVPHVPIARGKLLHLICHGRILDQAKRRPPVLSGR